MPDTRQADPSRHHKAPRVEIRWTAVRYRDVVIYGLLVSFSLFSILYLVHPEWFGGLTRRIIGGLNAAAPTTASLAMQDQARFVTWMARWKLRKSAR